MTAPTPAPRPDSTDERERPGCCGQCEVDQCWIAMEDWDPLGEDVSTHTMMAFFQHDDGRECSFHSRLNAWTFGWPRDKRCLRDNHPDLRPAPRSDAPEPSTVDAGGLSAAERAALIMATIPSASIRRGGEFVTRDRPWDEVLADTEAAVARIVADREERARAEGGREALLSAAEAFKAQQRERARSGSLAPWGDAYEFLLDRASSAPTEGEQR